MTSPERLVHRRRMRRFIKSLRWSILVATAFNEAYPRLRPLDVEGECVLISMAKKALACLDVGFDTAFEHWRQQIVEYGQREEAAEVLE